MKHWKAFGPPTMSWNTALCIMAYVFFFFMFLLIKNTFNMWHKHVTQLLACFSAARWCTFERLSDGGLFKKGVQVPCMDGFSVCQNCLIFCTLTPDSFLSLSTHSFISSGVLFFTSTILLLPFTKKKRQQRIKKQHLLHFPATQTKSTLTKIRDYPRMLSVSFSDINSNFWVVLCELHDILVYIFPEKTHGEMG